MSTTAVAAVAAVAVADAGGPDVEAIAFPQMPGVDRAVDRAAVLVVALTGSLVVANRQALKELIVDELAAGRRRVVLDCGSCGYIDASGLGVLFSVTRKADAVGGRVVLAGLNEDLMTLCEITKMDAVLVIRPRVIDALAHLAPIAMRKRA